MEGSFFFFPSTRHLFWFGGHEKQALGRSDLEFSREFMGLRVSSIGEAPFS
jgi:hypothetical protein